MLRVVQNRSLADQVFEQLAAEILTERCAIGTNLPAERKLVETFKVNRHVVREALKRLEQVGLIKISHGGGSRVADYWRHAGLDLLALMAEYPSAGEGTKRHWKAVHEMRRSTAADVARLCARRASPELKAEIAEIARKMREVADGPELFALDLRFWDRLLDGADNIAYRLAFNSLIKGILAPAVADFARSFSIAEIKQSGYRMAIANAILAGDSRAAELETRAALRGMGDGAGRAGEIVEHKPVRAAAAAAKRKAASRARRRG
jgi:GntR family transcriptional regulator, transcriptional repressor for pyruvate dehydrogenase complex